MSLPLVTIIIPVFNRANIILDTLNSIKEQTYRNWECIIVDDDSTDQTINVINEFSKNDSRFNIFIRPKERNKGANACRNYGLSLANGEFVIFFDSDDVMKNTCLEQRIKSFSEHMDKDFLVFSMGVFRNMNEFEVYPHRKVINLNTEKTIENFILSDTLPWNVCRPIFKTKLIKNKIAFNEKMQNFQDEEFNIRVLGCLKADYLSIDITDCYYRFDQASVNKYNTSKGKQDIVNCFYEFYSTVFTVLNIEQKMKYKEKLLLKFFNHIRFYAVPEVDKKEIFRTLKLFQKMLQLTLKDVALIYVMIFLNNFYYNKKGYNILVTRLKKLL